MRSRNTFLPKKQKARLNAPPEKEPWAWLTQELLSSDAFRSLSITANRVLFRVIIEHTKHAGLENGRLKVTYDDFECYGCRRKSLKQSIDAVVCSGLLAIARPGRLGYGVDPGAATEYRLTWLPVGTESDFQPATNGWKAAKIGDSRQFSFARYFFFRAPCHARRARLGGGYANLWRDHISPFT